MKKTVALSMDEELLQTIDRLVRAASLSTKKEVTRTQWIEERISEWIQKHPEEVKRAGDPRTMATEEVKQVLGSYGYAVDLEKIRRIFGEQEQQKKRSDS